MKNVLFFAAFLALWSMGACKSETAGSHTNDQAASSQQAEPSPEEVIGIVPYEGGVISEQSQKLLDGLSTGYWYVAGYVSIKDPDNAPKEHMGRWYQFTRDGHITAGKWKEQKTAGTWTYHPQKAILTIRTEDPSYTGEYTIKLSRDNSIMIWVGTPTYRQTDVQAKLENYLQLMDTLP